MSTATNELENAIRFAGKVTNGIQTYSVEGNSVGRLTAKSQDIVEIGIEDLLALFEAQRTRIELEARKDELHNIDKSMLTTKGLMWVIARNQEIKEQLTALDRKEEAKS